jgi:radical SAM protein with 4Fe4S-binding SPASM domain
MSLDDFKYYMGRIPIRQTIHFSGFSEPFGSYYCRDMIKYCIEHSIQFKIFSTLGSIDPDDIALLKTMPAYTVFVHVKGPVPDIFDNPQTAIFVGSLPFNIPKGWKQINQDAITRAGNNGGSDNDAGHKAHKCIDARHDQNVLLPNGDIVVCCMDYGLEYILGNLNENTLSEIMRGERYNKFRSDLLNGTNELCNKCFRGVS